MESELPNGDIVLIKQSMNIDDGQIYEVEFNGQIYIKNILQQNLFTNGFHQ